MGAAEVGVVVGVAAVVAEVVDVRGAADVVASALLCADDAVVGDAVVGDAVVGEEVAADAGAVVLTAPDDGGVVVAGAVVDSLSDGTLVGEAPDVVVGARTGTRSVADGGTV